MSDRAEPRAEDLARESLEVTRDDARGIVHVVMKGPAKGNAMGPAFWR